MITHRGWGRPNCRRRASTSAGACPPRLGTIDATRERAGAYSSGGPSRFALFAHEAEFHEALDQDALDHEALDQDAELQEALDQDAELQEALDQDALDQEALFHEAFADAVSNHAVPSKVLRPVWESVVTNWLSPAFGLALPLAATAEGPLTTPTPIGPGAE